VKCWSDILIPFVVRLLLLLSGGYVKGEILLQPGSTDVYIEIGQSGGTQPIGFNREGGGGGGATSVVMLFLSTAVSFVNTLV